MTFARMSDFTAVGLIVTVGHLALERANPKAFAFSDLSRCGALLDDFNREIVESALTHCLAERRLRFAVLQKSFFNRLSRLTDVKLPVQCVCYLVNFQQRRVTSFLLTVIFRRQPK